MAHADDLMYSFATPDDRVEVLHFYEHEYITREPMMRRCTEIMYKLHEGFDPFEDEAVDKVLHYTVLCIAEDYSGREISYRMCEMSEKRGKEVGAKYVQANATNIKSQRIFQEMGFQVRGSIENATYDVDGQKLFDTTLMGYSTCVQLMTKKL